MREQTTLTSSIRARLALVFTTVMGLVLVVFGLALYASVQGYLIREIDSSLAELSHHVASSISTRGYSSAMAIPDLDPFASPGVHVQVLDGYGVPIAHSAGLGMAELPHDRASVDSALAGMPTYHAAEIGAESIRVYSMPIQNDGHVAAIVQVGKSYHDVELTLSQLGKLLIGGAALALLVAASVSWAVASRALQPVADITSAARAIAESPDLTRRLKVGQTRDELGQLSAAFNEMLEGLEAAYTAQKRFVADASHELRAPLTTIRGNLEFVLRARDLPAEGRNEALADGLAEAERMARLVNDLLALARSDAGQIVGFHPVALHKLLLQTWPHIQARANGLELVLDAPDQAVVRGDPDRLKQVLLILLDNSMKYTPIGGRVEVSLRRRANEAILRVVDTGIGISPDDLPHIFERFYRADKARERVSGGSGLGLAIARAIVHGHGGSIGVESRTGEGSTFTVRLPVWSTRVSAESLET